MIDLDAKMDAGVILSHPHFKFLSTRATNCLCHLVSKQEITYRQFINMHRDKLKLLPNCGSRTIDELRELQHNLRDDKIKVDDMPETIRDKFAVVALNKIYDDSLDKKELIRRAYDIADSMIEARKAFNDG